MTDLAASLRCPNCGAPAASDAARCDYCHTTLATVGCPNCFQLLFDGAAFCPHCGAARSRVDRPEPTTLKCPACRAAMRWVTVGSVDLLECTECDGTWLEAATFERLCSDRENQSAMLQRPAIDRSTASADTGPIRYRPCPRCGKLMNRVNFGHVSAVIVDVCRGHGTFLDRGELHRVVDFVMHGGFDRARQAERESIVEEQRRLRDATLGQPATTGWSTWNDRGLHALLSAILGRRD